MLSKTKIECIVVLSLLAFIISNHAMADAYEVKANILVEALFKDQALVKVDGKQHLLKLGESTPEGFILIKANSREASFNIHGKIETFSLGLDTAVGFANKEGKASVTIAADSSGHYRTRGTINGFPVDFLLDTGASYLAMNTRAADEMKIDYEHGTRTRASTANGVIAAHIVELDRVKVGDILVYNVPAMILEENSLPEVLLGMSYLRFVNMQSEQGLMRLTKK